MNYETLASSFPPDCRIHHLENNEYIYGTPPANPYQTPPCFDSEFNTSFGKSQNYTHKVPIHHLSSPYTHSKPFTYESRYVESKPLTHSSVPQSLGYSSSLSQPKYLGSPHNYYSSNTQFKPASRNELSTVDSNQRQHIERNYRDHALVPQQSPGYSVSSSNIKFKEFSDNRVSTNTDERSFSRKNSSGMHNNRIKPVSPYTSGLLNEDHLEKSEFYGTKRENSYKESEPIDHSIGSRQNTEEFQGENSYGRDLRKRQQMVREEIDMENKEYMRKKTEAPHFRSEEDAYSHIRDSRNRVSSSNAKEKIIQNGGRTSTKIARENSSKGKAENPVSQQKSESKITKLRNKVKSDKNVTYLRSTFSHQVKSMNHKPYTFIDYP